MVRVKINYKRKMKKKRYLLSKDKQSHKRGLGTLGGNPHNNISTTASPRARGSGRSAWANLAL